MSYEQIPGAVMLGLSPDGAHVRSNYFYETLAQRWFAVGPT